MRHLNAVSIALTVAGLLALLAVPLFGLDGVWALGGLLLVWAGLVKVVVVAIWKRAVDQPPEPELPSRR